MVAATSALCQFPVAEPTPNAWAAEGAGGVARPTSGKRATPVAKEALPPAASDEVSAALRRVESSPGPEQIAALRRLWSLWDKVDPARVEAALAQLQKSARLRPSSQAYAGTLAAFARTRRGDFAAAKTKLAQLGFVDRWIVVGPFDNQGKTGLSAKFAPELEFSRPLQLGQVFPGHQRMVKVRAVPEVFPYGWLDLGSLLRPSEEICAYATTFVRFRDATGQKPITAWIGTLGAYRFLVNGRELFTDDAYRRHDVDRTAVPVVLEPGYNDFTFKLCGDAQAPMLSLRLAGEDGGPHPQLEFSNDAALGTEARRPRPTAAPLRAAPTVEGPLTELRARAEHPDASAEALFAYADYLSRTNGDDPTRHEARDAAVHAAERGPTVERLLFAATLAEDRNQRTRWIERAQALVGDGRHDVRLLSAFAELAREGKNPREALTLYEQILRLDPQNLDALVHRAELIARAGLGQTALFTLKTALARRPNTIALLRAVAERLREQGRVAESMEIERRYARLRYDDGAWQNHMLALALARQDRSTAKFRMRQILEMSPAAEWAHMVTANAHRRLGEVAEARAAYRRWLEICPDHVGALRQLADLEGEQGQRTEQLALLRQILEIVPQDKETRDYLEHLSPKKVRLDEKHAWPSERFLALRHAPKQGQNRRTLRDLTVTQVFPNGLSTTFRQLVFQPLTDGAAALARQYAFPYQADRQQVELRGARVFRMDGRIDEAIETGEAPVNDPSIAMYTSARTFYVQFPRLEPGDVVELKYRLEDVTPRNEYADYFGELSYFEADGPVANAEYILLTPKSRRMVFETNLGRAVSHEQRDLGELRLDRFFVKELTSIDPEPQMPPFPEVGRYVHSSTFDSFESMGHWYRNFVRDQLDLDEETRRLAKKIVGGAVSELDRVKAVYRWVTENTRYVGLEFGVYGYKPYRAVQTVARGWGDCKDKASAIVTLLRAVGIEANLVIVRTQMRGEFSSKIASLSVFDHAIAYVPSLDLYLDGTAEGTGVFELPIMDQGALALIIDEQPRLVRLPDKSRVPNQIDKRVELSLDGAGGGRADVSIDVRGAGASRFRTEYEAEATRRERLAAALAEDFSGFMIDGGEEGVEASGLDDPEQPVTLRVRGSSPQIGRREEAGLSLPVTTHRRLVPVYASLSSRKHPVRLLGVPNRRETFEIRLRPGQRVLATPESSRSDGAFGSYAVTVEQRPSSITVSSEFMLKKTRVEPEEYQAFRDFCVRADQALSQRLVVSR